MHNHYRDILDRIAEPPTWFDDNGVPRYSSFSPAQLANIHAREAALADISCQGCGRRFRVALTQAFADRGFSLGDAIRLRRVSYGDPPDVGCCASGPSMTSDMRAVLEYWTRDFETDFDWHRDAALEGPVPEHWRDPPDIVGDVRAALNAGATTILVVRTSRQNRFDIAGRITAESAAASDGRLNVVCPETYRVVARKMLDGHVPDADVGSLRDGRMIALGDFPRVKDAEFARDDVSVVMSGPPPRRSTSALHPRGIAQQEIWTAAARRIAGGLDGSRRIELALAHSRPMLDSPDAVIDAGRVPRPYA